MLRNFFDDDGRLHTIPSKHAKLLVVLDRLAQEFEPGQTYPEPEVNEVLAAVPPRLRGAAPLPGRERLPDPRGRPATGAAAGPSRSDEPTTEISGEDWYGEELARRPPRGRPVRRGRPHRGPHGGCDVRGLHLRPVPVQRVGARGDGVRRLHLQRHATSSTPPSTAASSPARRSRRCTLKPITVRGGQWRGVVLRGADLTGQDLSGVDLREADLSMAVLVGAILRGANLGGAELREADLTRRRPARRRAWAAATSAPPRSGARGSTWPAPYCSPS